MANLASTVSERRKEFPMPNPHENPTEHEIIVNMRPRKWAEDTITFEQLVALAYPEPAPAQRIYTVGWKHGHEQGSLVAGQSVQVRSGMKFSVTFTDRS